MPTGLRLRYHRLAIAVIVAAGALATSSTPAQAATISVGLSVPLVPQKQANWCWAASAQAVVKYVFGIDYSQCDQANDRFSRSDCCQNPSSSSCNQVSTLADVGNYLASKKGINSTHEWWRLSWAQVTAEIGTARRPFLIRIGWGGSPTLGHVEVVRGFNDYSTSANSLGVMDPVDGARYAWYTWTYFINNADFTWSNTLWKLNR